MKAHPAIRFKGQRVGADPIEEIPIVTDHDQCSGKILQGALKAS